MERPRELARAAAEAARCGVTRLADVTGLDRIGVPVFQAIRPWSRALSVHQGKGLTPDAAQIGALMEAIESDRAEAFDAPKRSCAFNDLPEDERPRALADFSSAREKVPGADEPLAWVEAQRLDGGGAMWVPFDAVSLDFTRRGDDRLDRSSNGVGARFDRAGAIEKALLEVIERDADAEWKALPIEQRSLGRLDLGSVPYGWFQRLRQSLSEADLRLSIYRQTAVIPVPVFLAQIIEVGAEAAERHAVYGVACHPSAEQALLGSLLEAVQSRATAISGARDDIYYPAPGRSGGIGFGFALPLPPPFRPKAWAFVTPDKPTSSEMTVAELIRLLAQAGYPDAAIVDLAGPDSGISVVKAFVPGLAAFGRRRR